MVNVKKFFKFGPLPSGDIGAKQKEYWGEVARFLLWWISFIGLFSLGIMTVIWTFVILGLSPNNPPVEIYTLIPFIITAFSCALSLLMLETMGKGKFYTFGVVSLCAAGGSLAIVIIYYVRYTSFMFSCPGDPNTLQPFICQSGVSRNSLFVSFAFEIINDLAVLLIFGLNAAVMATSQPPTMDELKKEFKIEVDKTQRLYKNTTTMFTPAPVFAPVPGAPPGGFIPGPPIAVMPGGSTFVQQTQPTYVPSYGQVQQMQPMQMQVQENPYGSSYGNFTV